MDHSSFFLLIRSLLSVQPTSKRVQRHCGEKSRHGIDWLNSSLGLAQTILAVPDPSRLRRAPQKRGDRFGHRHRAVGIEGQGVGKSRARRTPDRATEHDDRTAAAQRRDGQPKVESRIHHRVGVVNLEGNIARLSPRFCWMSPRSIRPGGVEE